MSRNISWTDTILYPRPTEPFITVKREPVADQQCPECGSSDIRRYPLVDWMGAKIATKCQSCFHVLALREPVREDQWPPYWPVTHDWAPSLAERAHEGPGGPVPIEPAEGDAP